MGENVKKEQKGKVRELKTRDEVEGFKTQNELLILLDERTKLIEKYPLIYFSHTGNLNYFCNKRWDIAYS